MERGSARARERACAPTPHKMIFCDEWGGTGSLVINGIPIEDTFAEAFPMTAARLLVTAATPAWALTAGQMTTGYAASVIGFDPQPPIQPTLTPPQTPPARPPVTPL